MVIMRVNPDTELCSLDLDVSAKKVHLRKCHTITEYFTF